MKERFNWDAARVVRLTRFATFAVVAVFAVSATAIGGVAFFSGRHAAQEEARAKSLDVESGEIARVLSEAKTRVAVNVRNQSKAVADFQENVSRLAAESEVELSEFLASTDFQPYLTRFAKKNDGAGWSQVEIQVTVAGETRNVVDAIGLLARQSVPFEFNSVQITREAAGSNATRVTAKLQLRVLVKTPGEPA